MHAARRKTWSFAWILPWILALVGALGGTSLALGQSDAALALPEVIESGASDEHRQAIDAGVQWTDSLSTQWAEWLGPMAPVAMSPFFGLTCLSGVASYGPPWLQERSHLLRKGGPMDRPGLFWTMLALTVLTTLPRLTKVSKPLALLGEKLEAYSAIIILIAVRFLDAPGSTASPELAAGEALPWVSAGIGSVSLELLMAAAAVLNIVVINTVKLFCEFVIWITPIPLVDAAFDLLNKSLCAGLMALYLWSPAAATVVNLILLAACASVFWTVQKKLWEMSRRAIAWLRALQRGQPLPQDAGSHPLLHRVADERGAGAAPGGVGGGLVGGQDRGGGRS